MSKSNRYLICLVSVYSDEAVAAFVETAGGSLKELSLNNVKKVNGSVYHYVTNPLCHTNTFFNVFRLDTTQPQHLLNVQKSYRFWIYPGAEISQTIRWATLSITVYL